MRNFQRIHLSEVNGCRGGFVSDTNAFTRTFHLITLTLKSKHVGISLSNSH